MTKNAGEMYFKFCGTTLYVDVEWNSESDLTVLLWWYEADLDPYIKNLQQLTIHKYLVPCSCYFDYNIYEFMEMP